MNVPTPTGEVVLVDPRVHREDVVRRLLRLGVHGRTLLALLPDWDGLIRTVLAEEAAAACTAVDDGVINRDGPLWPAPPRPSA